MGDKITLKISRRDVLGKKVKSLRKQGITPGIVYGAGMEATPIQADAGEVVRVYYAAGKHTPIQLAGTKRRIAMIKDVELNPTRHGAIRHISFHAVRADEPVVAEVPIRMIGVGESPAEKAGLIVLQALDKIEVKALPMDLPEALEISIGSLENEGDRIVVSDIALPEGVEIVEHDDGRDDTEEDSEASSVSGLTIASVYEPSALEAANEAAAGDADDEGKVEVEGAEDDASDDSAEKTE